jgi:bifunctional UDP-N-acetylglucosamine pyrophosphorylase/glucosamine-1-phosphate N-acetyltransferase
MEPSVSIGRDTVIEPGVYLQGKTEIGEDCRIGQGAVIEASTLGNNVVIKPYSVIEKSTIDAGAVIGPFAHLRPESEIGREAKVGNFVEIKKSRLAPGVKASHLTYLGDTTIGEDTNIGAGTITCNYDGKRKHPTTIGKNVFVGSNTALVAPVSVGDGSTIAAGSVITKKIPPDTLAVARARQQNIYRHHRRKKEN